MNMDELLIGKLSNGIAQHNKKIAIAKNELKNDFAKQCFTLGNFICIALVAATAEFFIG